MDQRANTFRLNDYALAIGVFAAALLARFALDQIIPGQLAYITYFPAVVAAAYFSGPGPAILVLLLSATAGTTLIEEPSGSTGLLGRAVGVALFFGLSGLNIYLVNRLRAANALLRAQDEQLSLINRELKHRIKNLFTIATSICQQTMRTGVSVDQMSVAVAGRIQAIASAQDLLSVRSEDGADLAPLVGSLVATVAPTPSQLTISGPAVKLGSGETTPFALILHELATNALKYGAWSGKGIVNIRWMVEGANLHFEWREHDGPTVAPPVREGLGSLLIKKALPNASINHELKPDGLQCRILLPLAKRAGTTLDEPRLSIVPTSRQATG